MRPLSIAMRPAQSGFWLNAPKVVLTLQRSRLVSEDDLKRYVVGLILPVDDVERFITPLTSQDKVFWSHGHDQGTLLSDAFQLFDTVGEAMESASRWRCKQATVYGFVEDSEHAILFLEPEAKTNSPTRPESR